MSSLHASRVRAIPLTFPSLVSIAPLMCSTFHASQGNLKMRPMVLPDTFIEAGTQTEQYEEAGLSAGHIRASVLRLFDQTPVPTLSASKAPASK